MNDVLKECRNCQREGEEEQDEDSPTCPDFIYASVGAEPINARASAKDNRLTTIYSPPGLGCISIDPRSAVCAFS